MSDLTIRHIPDDEPEVTIAPRTESVEYEITDAGKTVDIIDTASSANEAPVLTKEQIAERVLLRKAHELNLIRRMLKKGKLDSIRSVEREKQKSKNRKKNKAARASRKKNKR